jgi:hypothetical protein
LKESNGSWKAFNTCSKLNQTNLPTIIKMISLKNTNMKEALNEPFSTSKLVITLGIPYNKPSSLHTTA